MRYTYTTNRTYNVIGPNAEKAGARAFQCEAFHRLVHMYVFGIRMGTFIEMYEGACLQILINAQQLINLFYIYDISRHFGYY